ncbi:MAG TPA: TIGR03905 family TSCPD domain-containing protein [Selenomonadales bacterium]|nr:TIGR03905 family TSCPD domain-containing protein [Selenomonadales bacterium]
MVVSYATEGVCSKEIKFEVENGVVKQLAFVGGCPGNLSAIAKLVEGMPVEDVIRKLKGNLCRNQTSCADQLARALEEYRSR